MRNKALRQALGAWAAWGYEVVEGVGALGGADDSKHCDSQLARARPSQSAAWSPAPALDGNVGRQSLHRQGSWGLVPERR